MSAVPGGRMPAAAWVLRACVAAAVLPLTSCAGVPEGTLSVGAGEDMRLCVDPGSEVRALGATFVSNTGTSVVTITDVAPQGSVDLEVQDAYLIAPDDAYTVAGAVPPGPEDPWSETGWRDRLPAVGAHVEPGQTWQLIQLMRTTSDRSSFEALQVEYEQDGVSHSATTSTSMGVTGTGVC